MRLTLTTFVTLDGVLQSPGQPEEDPSGGFAYGGWQVPYFDDDFMRRMLGWFEAADAFLLGRRTYDIFAAYWPRVTDPDNLIAAKLNQLPKYVVSTTLREPAWKSTTVIPGDVPTRVTELKGRPGGELQVHGSGVLARGLLDHGLVDEIRLWTYPVVLGTGARLFEPGATPAALRLVETAPTRSGAVLQVYEPAGSPTFGTTALADH